MDSKPLPPHLEADIWLEVRLNQTQSHEDSRHAYEAIYTDAHLSQRESFYLWLADVIAWQPQERYLDISCGRAELTTLAQQHGALATGIDISFAAVHHAAQATHCESLVTADAQILPYADDSFDVVSNIGSMEHYFDMQMAACEMARVLRRGGRAMVLVPNTWSLMTNIWLAMRHGRTSVDYFQPIQRYGGRYEWQDLLEGCGLTVVDTRKYDIEVPRTRADWMTYLKHPKHLVRLVGGALVPLNLAFHFLFICEKR